MGLGAFMGFGRAASCAKYTVPIVSIVVSFLV